MNISHLKGCALFSCAAVALLTACGGSPPIGTPSTMQSRATQARPTHVTFYKVLHSFKAAGSDGAHPQAGLMNLDGTLYGTTSSGGRHGDGVIFRIATSGNEGIVYDFRGEPRDGASPWSSLTNVAGTLSGTTLRGGSHDDGSVYSITTSGEEKLLHSFGGSGDGRLPYGGVANANGKLYGTTQIGGTSNLGTVYVVAKSGKETVLHSFTGPPDGEDAYAPLLNVKGTFFGTTAGGGESGNGIVYSITPSGAEMILFNFSSGGDWEPYGGLIYYDGALYGTTVDGGQYSRGTIFSSTPSGTESIIYNFGGTTGDGQDPWAAPIAIAGTFYGTTYQGGASGYGTLYAMTSSGQETILHNFGSSTGDGKNPRGSLIEVKGVLYGTTVRGGAHARGTVFSITL